MSPTIVVMGIVSLHLTTEKSISNVDPKQLLNLHLQPLLRKTVKLMEMLALKMMQTSVVAVQVIIPVVTLCLMRRIRRTNATVQTVKLMEKLALQLMMIPSVVAVQVLIPVVT